MVLGVQIYETTIIDTWRGLSIYRWIKLDQARSITYYSNKKDVGGEKECEHLRQDDFSFTRSIFISVCSTYADILMQLGMGERVG